MKSYYQTEDDYYKQGCDRINSEKCKLLQKKMDTIGKKYYDFGVSQKSYQIFNF